MSIEKQNIQWPDWKIGQKLGGGSFGSVYEMQRDIFGTTEKAALKVISIPPNPEEGRKLLHQGFSQDSINRRYKSDMEQIAKEYQLMAKLKGHSNIVHCEDIRFYPQAGGIGWNLCIKMELLTPMHKVLMNPMQDMQVIKLGMDICNALIACRKANIIHRDIKPDNIMVSADGTFKLGDFGVAKTTERTAGGTKTGTFNYMAPEVYNNQPYSFPADQYSLGMVMYWMLNRRTCPFLNPSAQLPTAMQQEEAMRRRFSGEKLPQPVDGSMGLKQLVLKACAFRPADRYGSPEELYQALAALTGSGSGTYGGTASRGTVSGGSSYGSGSYSSGSYRSGSYGGTQGGSYGGTQGNGWEPTAPGTVDGGWGKGPRTGSGVTGGTRGGTQGGTRGGTQGGTSGSGTPGTLDTLETLTVTAAEARNGCSKPYSLPRGENLIVKIPAGTGQNKILRIAGKGKQDPATGARGDLLLMIKISNDSKDFWNQEPPKQVVKYNVCISTQEAKKGGVKSYNFADGASRKVTIPANCKDGQVVEDVKIYVHTVDITTTQAQLRSMPDVVLQEYTKSSGMFMLFLGIMMLVVFLSGFLGPLAYGFGALGAIYCIYYHTQWQPLRKEAKRLMERRNNGQDLHI